MRASAGVDVISLQRMRDAVEITGQVFLDRVFTPLEQTRAERHPDPVAYFATRFAGKEAIFKSFGIDRTGIEFTDIEIQDGPYGAPVAVLRGRLAALASERRADVSVSLAYDGELAIASAVLSGE